MRNQGKSASGYGNKESKTSLSWKKGNKESSTSLSLIKVTRNPTQVCFRQREQGIQYRSALGNGNKESSTNLP